MSTITPYEKLTFSNDFLFCKILETKTELCKELVELIFGRKVKEIRNVRSQFSLKLSLGDKTQKVFLCTEGDKEDVSSEIMDFLDYVAGRKLEGKIAKELDAEVKNAREKEEWRAEYMQNMAAIMDAKREGRAEGRAEGKAEGMDNLSKLINHLAKQGLTDEILKVTSDETYRDQMLKTLNLI